MLEYYVMGFALLGGLEVLYLLYHMYKKQVGLRQIFQDWENFEHSTFSKDELAFIKKEALRKRPCEIDDITWHDLDMDMVFQSMNICLSSAGDLSLYRMLRNPLYDEEQILMRKKLVNWGKEQKQQRDKVRTALFQIGCENEVAIEEIYRSRPLQMKAIFISACFSCLLLVALLIASFFRPELLMFPVLLGVINTVIATKYHKEYGDVFVSALYLNRYVDTIRNIDKYKLEPWLQDELGIDACASSLKKIKHSLFSDMYSADGFFFLFIGSAFFGELITFYRLYQKLLTHKKDIHKAVVICGDLDAYISISGYQENQSVLCDAQIGKQTKLCAQGMVHPLLLHPVANDVDASSNILISGSNASGKSTFLKMIAINCIFAQTFGFALAKDYKACAFKLYTSMALQDSIANNDSYFVAEIKSMKRILAQVKSEIPILCMIDEILRGTNTGERIAAASEVLMSFVNHGAICLAATHDIELTRILEHHYHNMHFSEEIGNKEMSFAYRIQDGPSHSRNAIALLGMLGFADETVQNAEKVLQDYEANGTWMRLKREVIVHEV